jgi:hypothetical protein
LVRIAETPGSDAQPLDRDPIELDEWVAGDGRSDLWVGDEVAE